MVIAKEDQFNCAVMLSLINASEHGKPLGLRKLAALKQVVVDRDGSGIY